MGTPAGHLMGKKIAFERSKENDYDICVMNSDGSGLRNLTNNTARGRWPCWSPDGKKIAFVTQKDLNSDICVMNSDGSGLRNLTNNTAQIGGFASHLMENR